MRTTRGIGAALIYMACIGVTFAVTVIITTWFLFHNPPEFITNILNQITSAISAKGENK